MQSLPLVCVALLVGTTAVSTGCQPPAREGHVTPIPTQPTAGFPSRSTPAAGAATAVRVLLVDPRDVILAPADVAPGFVTQLDEAVDELRLSAVPAPFPSTPSRQRNRTGAHVVITQQQHAGKVSGVLSVETTAVRYELTSLAVSAYQDVLKSMPASRSEPMLQRIGQYDNASAWQQRFASARVQEIALRIRNMLLSVVVASNYSADRHVAFEYMEKMRSRVSH